MGRNPAQAPKPPFDVAARPPRQRDVHAQIVARRGDFPLPYQTLLASPEVALTVEALSTQLWAGSLTKATLESVFLVVARRLRCEHQWTRHSTKALAAGVSPQAIDAIDKGLKPDGPADLVVACQLARRLLAGQALSPTMRRTATAQLGERGVAELCAFLGLAATVAMAIRLQAAE